MSPRRSILTALLLVSSVPLLNCLNIITGILPDVEEAGTYIVSTHCQKVKKILGIEYDEIEEPDLSELTVDFITKHGIAKYKLNELWKISTSPCYNASAGLILYMHGFMDSPYLSFTKLNKAFHERGNYNIAALDASLYTKFFYLYASTLVIYIGENVGRALVALIDNGLPPSSIYLIGASLGAHITGFTGRTLFKLTGLKVGRITGLDPAGPCFAEVNSTLRLTHTDASFVDIIHTNAGVYGLDEIIGQVDYFPNNGKDQPGCKIHFCSHLRALELYAESVSNITRFPALKCDSWTDFKNGDCDNNPVSYMGYASKPGTTGKYYVITNGHSPFSLGLLGN